MLNEGKLVWFQVSKYNVSTMPVVTMDEITEFCRKITVGFSVLTLKVLVGWGVKMRVIIIIIFCYSPKHYFRLFEGQQSTVGVKHLLRRGSNHRPLEYKASVFTLMPYPCSHFYFDIKFVDRLYLK